MKIYTKSGDGGQTGLFAGGRVSKDHPRIEACGTIDELNALLGLARSQGLPPDVDQVVSRIQSDLFTVGAQLAAADAAESMLRPVSGTDVEALEQAIDRWEKSLPPLKNFILPGGAASAATLHVARTVCRRAERRVVGLASATEQPVSDGVICYLNRLSDLLFVAARAVNADHNVPDCLWQSGR
jgi:cob(I)alamin adenosyltransferase